MFTFHNRPRQMRITRNTSQANRQRICAIRAVRNQRFHRREHVIEFLQALPLPRHFAIEEVPTAKERRCSYEKNRECHANFGQRKSKSRVCSKSNTRYPGYFTSFSMTRVHHKRLRENTRLRVSMQNGKSVCVESRSFAEESRSTVPDGAIAKPSNTDFSRSDKRFSR